LNITDVRVKLMHHRTDRLRAFCSITIDGDFVVHDLRVIEGRKGLFVAMPSRKLSDNCPRCGAKNELRSKFCAECGAKLDENRAPGAAGPRDKYHVDVAHPINTPCREMLQSRVLAAYREEEGRAREGLPPLHEYAQEGLDESPADYVEIEYEEPAPVPAPQGQAPGQHVAAGPETEAATERAAEGPEQGVTAEPSEAGRADQRPQRSKRERDLGGFGQGIL